MADKISKETRSRIMARIRSKNTKIELVFRKQLSQNGFRGYRLHYAILGRPDVVFTKKRLAIFIDGDFWHGYNWKVLGKLPPRKYWRDKINKNIKRDFNNSKKLRKEGWLVLRFWEHELKRDLSKCISKLEKTLNKVKT